MKTLQELEAQLQGDLWNVAKTSSDLEERKRDLENLCITIRQVCITEAYGLVMRGLGKDPNQIYCQRCEKFIPEDPLHPGFPDAHKCKGGDVT